MLEELRVGLGYKYVVLTKDKKAVLIVRLLMLQLYISILAVRVITEQGIHTTHAIH